MVAFDVGGLPDMVQSDVTGVLVPRGDIHGLGSAIAALLSDDERHARMARDCRRVAVEQYSLEIQAERYRLLYQELLAKQRRAAPGAISHRSLSDICNALPDAR